MTEKIVPTFVEYTTLSGVTLYISPLNIPAVKAIGLKAAELFPYPDPTPYRKQMENAVEGVLTPPEDDPDYVALVTTADSKRNEWSNRAILDYCVTFPDFSGRDEILNFFAAKRDALRKIAKFEDNDDWNVTLYHIILSGSPIRSGANRGSDFVNVLNICVQSVELTGGEVLNGIRMFRPQIRGYTAGTVDRQASGL